MCRDSFPTRSNSFDMLRTEKGLSLVQVMILLLILTSSVLAVGQQQRHFLVLVQLERRLKAKRTTQPTKCQEYSHRGFTFLQCQQDGFRTSHFSPRIDQ